MKPEQHVKMMRYHPLTYLHTLLNITLLHIAIHPPQYTLFVNPPTPIPQVMKPEQPVKMMRYRGADDAVVNFGHFAEVRKLQTGPNDVVVPYKGDS